VEEGVLSKIFKKVTTEVLVGPQLVSRTKVQPYCTEYMDSWSVCMAACSHSHILRVPGTVCGVVDLSLLEAPYPFGRLRNLQWSPIYGYYCIRCRGCVSTMDPALQSSIFLAPKESPQRDSQEIYPTLCGFLETSDLGIQHCSPVKFYAILGALYRLDGGQ